jgi:hypothetical protein
LYPYTCVPFGLRKHASIMLDQSKLNHQLHELDRLLEALEQLNLRNQTVLRKGITNRLQSLGMVDVKGVDPPVLIPRVLDEQQGVRRRLASMRRGRTT